MNLTYRTAQFFRSLNARTRLPDLARTWPILTQSQRSLFLRLPPADQQHSLKVLDVLMESGEHDPDLLAAALLHDVGKLRHPLHLWERVFIVLARSIAPSWAAAKANPDGPGWQSALAVSEFHAQWGAEMLAEAGASQRLVDLVRRHQDPPSDWNNVTDRLLAHLQQADNQS